MMTLASKSYDIRDYESPLALLDHLISDRNIDLLDLPIAAISQQYCAVLQESAHNGLDMDLASEFILMAATLIHIKSRMLLWDEQEENVPDEDPRNDLVLQLMAHRRMKKLAEVLAERHENFAYSVLPAGRSPAELGISAEVIADELDIKKFWTAVEQLVQRNRARFNRQNLRIKRILRGERFSVRDSIRKIVSRLKKSLSFFFHELFPPGQAEKAEQVSGFLAILEMTHDHRLDVQQRESFGSILLSKCKSEEGEHD